MISAYARELAARQQENWERYSGKSTGVAQGKKAAVAEARLTAQQREKQLQSLLTTPAGRKEVQDLASRYVTASGRLRPPSTSDITYILVHEREQGLLRN